MRGWIRVVVVLLCLLYSEDKSLRLKKLYFSIGGSLCAVSVYRDLICSGYSSGAVVIWEGDVESTSSYRELVTTTVGSQGQKPQVASTAIHDTLCAAGFDNGII